jgi:hypothetical protein
VATEDSYLIAATVALYQHEDLWRQAQHKAGDCLSQFDAAVLVPELWQQIMAVQQQLAEHRAQSFTGSMLKYHHHRSTKFMGQWITAKNKLAALQQEEPSDGAS